jgi:hypothetical protein
MSLDPSKTAVVESEKVIFAFQSANMETNIPQTGHFSLAAAPSFVSAAYDAAARKRTRKHISVVLVLI